jgi:hypothetical protein
VPVVAGSADAEGLVSAPGVDCNGCVACAICGLRNGNLGQRRTGYDEPGPDHGGRHQQTLSQVSISVVRRHNFHRVFFAGSTDVTTHRSSRYSSPAPPSSSANAKRRARPFTRDCDKGLLHRDCHICVRRNVAAPAFYRIIRLLPIRRSDDRTLSTDPSAAKIWRPRKLKGGPVIGRRVEGPAA